ncbi:hypothetical protein N7532_000763 [Penicillium argentinense]|uniref:Uncharacterized protein n=1 Tax=Penicillium argentinense TaxID=1131581 RepID=A0A9W9G5Z4_9EURO|nr:uncharacterized protein N7532_000763 [Penicillium argentinense]KAJ5112718.1 hypothetical protein N7532_000763 [Penicillium argentinense]
MCPDINSLPPSRSSSSSSSLPNRNASSVSPGTPPGTGPAPANHTASTSTSTRPSRGSSIGRLSVSERRRSAAGMNISPSESLGTASGHHGETLWSDHRSSIGQAFRTTSPSSHSGGSPVFVTADPHHQRAPSLGELHQELEQEQEAQVNRLLQMIRSQQAQLQQYQQQSQHQNPQSTTAIDDTTPSSERSAAFFPPMPPPAGSGNNRLSISSLSNRRLSRPSSQTTSPNIRPQDAGRGSEPVDAFTGFRESSSRRGSRDEGAYYQAEATMLSRENQMLRQRIRELERQIGEMTTSTRPAASTTSGSGAAPGQEGAEAVDPLTLRSADGKD